ncbi:hypothetical protein JCM10207_004967 [Rhodosporidiobolus poonsookiae]
MSALRQLASVAPLRFSPIARLAARRWASTKPRPVPQPRYTLKERIVKFVPAEAYPLVIFVTSISIFGVVWGIRSLNVLPGDLRLQSSRTKKVEEPSKPWEDPRAIEGKW